VKRRVFITLLGGAAAAWPIAARAQQAGKLPTIGFVGSNASGWGPWTAAFVARLHDLGWIEGRTVGIEYRWSEGRPERIVEIAAEFVRRNVDIVVTNDSSAPTIKQATSVIPIVFVLGNDPIGTGLVTNLARPGGNVTGLSVQQTETDSKRLELLREVVPRLRRVAVVANFGNPSSVRQTRELQAAADALGLEVVPLEIRHADDIATAFAALNAQADALYIVQDALIVANTTRIMTFALTARLPTSFNGRDFVDGREYNFLDNRCEWPIKSAAICKLPRLAPENLLRRLPSTNHWTETIRHAARSGDMSLDSMTILNPVVPGKIFSTYAKPVAISSPLLKKSHSTLTSRTNLDVSFFTEIF
jgi:ABC transporter substrate binding protein